MQEYQAEPGVIPIDWKLFRFDVLKGALLLPICKIAFLLDEQSRSRREPIDLAAGLALNTLMVAGPASKDRHNTLLEFVRTQPTHAPSRRARSTAGTFV